MQGKRRARRRHGEEFKAKVLTACEEPGASIAAVAQAHELNANLVHKWRRQREVRFAAQPGPAQGKVDEARFVALALPTAAPASRAAAPGGAIRVQLRRGATSVVVSWPSEAAGECAAWLRGLLR